MTALLTQAFQKVAVMSEKEQNEFAHLIFAELEDQQQWSQSFFETQNELECMAQEAVQEFEDKKTMPIESFLR